MTKPVQKIIASIFAVSCLAFTGCQYRSKSDNYYLVATNLKLPYWKAVQDGFNKAAEEYTVSAYVVGPDTYDPDAEADALSKAIDHHPAGILISVADAGKLRDGINSAISAGIPVITVDSDAPLTSRLYFIGTNNLDVGRLGGQRLVERLHGKGNVVVFSIPGQPNIEERLKGYKDAIAASPGIKITEVVATGGSSDSAFDKTEELVHRTGDQKVDAFVCLESSAGTAIAEVLKRNNMSDRVLIAMDADADTMRLIGEGSIDATVSQKPFTMGYVGLKALDEAHRSHKGEFLPKYSTNLTAPYPAFIDTGSALITKDNVSLYQVPAK